MPSTDFRNKIGQYQISLNQNLNTYWLMLKIETHSRRILSKSPRVPLPVHLRGRISLKQRVLSAGIWSLAGYGCNQVLRFGSNLLMTRLLVPEMFGVMAIAGSNDGLGNVFGPRI